MAVVFEGSAKPRPLHGPVLSLDLPPTTRPAGWNREIAPSVFKEVDVCPTFLSDDAHTIGQPPRTTQPSIGRFVREVKHFRDATYGSHFALYSGVNLLPVFGERMKNVPVVPRTHHHFGTGVNAGFEAVKIHPTVRELRLVADRANWVPRPSEASALVVKLNRPSDRCLKEHQALFPFPKNVAKLHCLQPIATYPAAGHVRSASKERPILSSRRCEGWPPFWYNGSLERPTRPVGDPAEYDFTRLPSCCHGAANLAEEVQVDDPGYYIPGQIGSRCCDASATLSWRPLYESMVVPLRPPHEHYQLNPWAGQDRRP